MDAGEWDERYAASTSLWSDGPNELFASIVEGLTRGTALDVATGEGRTALWLAQQGWQASAVDFSAVGLKRASERAAKRGLEVDWQLRDVVADGLEPGTFDLVALLYLHVPQARLNDVLAACSAAVAAGGRLVIIGHDRENLARGTGGPQNADILYTAGQLQAAADASGLTVQRCEQVERPVGDATAIDTVLVATREL